MKYYTSNVTLLLIYLFTMTIAYTNFNQNLRWLNNDVLDRYLSHLLYQSDLPIWQYLLLTLVIPLSLLFLIFIGVSSLNNVTLNKDAGLLQEQNRPNSDVKEFFIVMLFRKYAYFLESIIGFLVGILFFILLLAFGAALIKIGLYNLGLLADGIFGSNWMSWRSVDKSVVEFNVMLLFCTVPLYVVLVFKLIYLFYVKTNFPMPSISKINVTSWLDSLHKKLNNDKHIASVIDQVFEKYVIDEKEGFSYYLKRFEIGSIARILFIVVFKTILKLVYLITRPILLLFKAKYFYYLLLPFVYIISFVFNFVFSLIYSLLKYVLAFTTFFVYISQVLMWITISILMLFLILLINSIAFETVLENYSSFAYIVSNLGAFIVINTFSALIVYVIIPEFSFYSNPVTVKQHFEKNIQSLGFDTKEKIRTLLFAVFSLILSFVAYYYLYDFVANKYELNNYQVLLNYFEEFKQFCNSKYKAILNKILNFLE